MGALSVQSLKELLATAEPPELGPGPRAGVKSEEALERVMGKTPPDADNAPAREQLARALVFLWHDHMDAAHRIAQDIGSADGSYVHGIVHRREPDYGNAQYWFRRVGEYPAFTELATRVRAMSELKADVALRSKLIPDGKWSVMRMVSACEEASCTGNRQQIQLLREVQRIETETLLEWLLQPARV
jgi:hypothetical protein